MSFYPLKMSHVSNVSNLFDHISLPLLPFNIAQALTPPFPKIIYFSLVPTMSCQCCQHAHGCGAIYGRPTSSKPNPQRTTIFHISADVNCS